MMRCWRSSGWRALLLVCVMFGAAFTYLVVMGGNPASALTPPGARVVAAPQ